MVQFPVLLSMGKQCDVAIRLEITGGLCAPANSEATDFAWECLRRNLDYREDYRSLQRGGSPAALSEEKFRERWGLSFRG